MRTLAGLFAALGLLLQSYSAALAQDSDESVRVATFNTYLLSPFFKCFNPNFADCLAQITGHTETWANSLADRILADTDRFDIIALNEVWDEDAKSILVRRLRPVYPTFVRDIDADLIQVRGQALKDILSGQPKPVVDAVFGGEPIGKINGEDSGLMLFAKRNFAFLPLPDPAFKWGAGSGEVLAATSPEIAFTLFTACAGSDCFAAKGAALARLRHSPSGRIFNVVFTHMQADYPGDNAFHASQRAAQFHQVQKMVETTLAPLDQREKRERVIMMGDLNVAPLTTGQAEWAAIFDAPGSFYARPLYDAWHRTTSPRDRGITHQFDRKEPADRLDYILSFPEPYDTGGREGPLCVQHMTIPPDFVALASDHFLVHADLNLGFFHCSPSIAYEVQLQPSPAPGQPPQESVFLDMENGTDITRISGPGAMQWFHVRKADAGTYSIGRTNARVELEVYAPEDLTTPISRYNKTTQTANILGDFELFIDTFVLPREFYIRTSGDTRDFTGDYRLWIKRHNCATKLEACILQPGQPQSATLTKAGNPFGIQNQAWFAFDVIGTSDGGLDQTISLTANGLRDPANFKATLVDFINSNGMAAPTPLVDGRRRVFTGQMGDGSAGYLVIEQASPTSSDAVVTARMDTSIRLLDIGNLICMDETNPEFGSDDIFTAFNVDGITTRAPPSGEVEFDCDDSRDEKNWAGAVGKPTITFIDKVSIKVTEEDDSSPNDPSRSQLLPALGPDDLLWDGRQSPLWWTFEGGEYHFGFVLRKRPNAPVK